MTSNTPVKALWRGDKDVLPDEASVIVLAYDRVESDNSNEGCAWVRWDGWGYPTYRSCNMGDLEISDADYAILTAPHLSDADLLAAYQRTDGEPGNPEADALAEELRRRDIDF